MKPTSWDYVLSEMSALFQGGRIPYGEDDVATIMGVFFNFDWQAGEDGEVYLAISLDSSSEVILLSVEDVEDAQDKMLAEYAGQPDEAETGWTEENAYLAAPGDDPQSDL